MDLKELLNDSELSPSNVWKACETFFGPQIREWEPDTFRLQLKRKGIDARPPLCAKFLGAQTIVTTNTWLADYDVLFAFALACQGIPAASDAFHHPHPEEIAWAISEIRLLRNLPENLDDQGFDPDDVDAAIACVLMDEGFAVAPDCLSFVDHVMAKMVYCPQEFRAKLKETWDRDWATLDLETLHGKAKALSEAKPFDMQLLRLAAVRAYVLEHEAARARYIAAIRL